MHILLIIVAKICPGASGGTYAIPRLGIPSITVNDGPAGVRYGTAIWYPSEVNISSSWDPILAREIGVSMAEDALAKDIDIILAPGMNIQKNILCGRNFEYISEDPILTAKIAAGYTDGIQSKGVGVSIKHFATNNQETSRGTVSSTVTERALREIYLKAFGMVVKSSDPYTIMSSYNKLNGQYVSTRYDMITTYLRKEIGFGGFVMSDWGSAGTVVEKVNAGNDINMPGYPDDPDKIISAYDSGLVDPLMLDAACRCLLGVVVRCHSFTDPDQRSRLDTKNHTAQVKDAAADTMVLLQNNDAALPLARGTTVALFGNGSVQTVYGGAGSGSVSTSSPVSIMNGFGSGSGLTVFDAKNSPFIDCKEHSVSDPSNDVVVTEAYAQACADGADVAVIVISRGSAEGTDRTVLPGDYKLNQTELDMINRVSEAFHAKGKKVVVLLNVCSPIEIVSWRESVDAILWIGYPGEQAGNSVAMVLTGKVNPSAKTTVTWPVSYGSTPGSLYFPGNEKAVVFYEDIYVGYRYYETFGVDVAYPFGYGLSYTQYEYSDFSIQKNADGTVTAKITVKNSGTVAGREIVQIYVSKPETTLEQAARELAGFGKTKLLAPGESETLTIVVPVEALTSYDTENSRYFIDKGSFTFAAGASSADIKLTAEITETELKVTQDVENIAAPDFEFQYIRKDTYKVPSSAEKENIAIGKTATDNGHEGNLAASNAVDGDHTTRWSGFGAPVAAHQFTLDLGNSLKIDQVRVYWEAIHGSFTLAISENGETYTDIGTYKVDQSYVSLLDLQDANARYLRVSVPRGGYCSFFEFEVYEAD